ncbi:60S acidic ribosomal protein P2 [Tulasnella sp. 417]|nr:60S acidic ribosomal protein P2 [Tulasnella sp. 417]
MRYIAAYLLLQIGGKANPGAADIKKVLTAGGVEVDDERLNKLLSELEGKTIDELVATGSSKLSSVPSGGAVVSSGGGGAAGGGGGAAPEAAKEEEKKEEAKEESDDDMGFGLFD